MIQCIAVASQIPMENEDVQICHRVFNSVCVEKGIVDEFERQDLAASIIQTYQRGVRDERSLKRLFA